MQYSTTMTKTPEQKSIQAILQSAAKFKYKIIKIGEAKQRKVHIIIGVTGQGKSTLLNALIENDLIAYKPKFKNIMIKAVKQRNDIKIGQNLSSTTTIPHFQFDEKTSLAYWDCPGFIDNKGPQQDITNGFYIKEIFLNCKEFKLIIVVSETSILDKALNLFSALDQILKIFPYPEKIYNALTLVLTKTTNFLNSSDFKEYCLTQILKSLGTSMSAKRRKLLEYLASPQGNVVLFPLPTQDGQIIDKNKAEEIKNSIKKRSNFIPTQIINTPLAPKSQIYLSDLAMDLNREIEQICESSNNMMKQKFFQIINSSYQYSFLKREVSKIIQSLEPIIIQKDHSLFFNQWIKIFQIYGLEFQIGKAQSIKSLIEQIRHANQKVQFTLQKWQKQFSVYHLLSKLSNQPNHTDEDLTLKIESYLLNSKQIQEIFDKNKTQKLKIVIVKCYHTLFIDNDLTMPGISLCILSDNWKVIGDRKIDLKGDDGEPYLDPAPSKNGYDYKGKGLDGEDGTPGRPGKSGGSFYGKLMSKKGIFGPGTLTIDVRGGNGGKGQKGGEGGEGKKGQNAIQIKQVDNRDKKFLVRRVPYTWLDKEGAGEKFIQILKSCGTFNAQMLETYRSVGKQGCKGGKGGRGGASGQPGQSGFVKFQGFQAKVQQGKGKSGQVGDPGLGGKGGENGKKYEGQYVNETLFTVFREEGKTIEQSKDQYFFSPIKTSINQVIRTAGKNCILMTGSSSSKALGGLSTLGISIAFQGVMSAYSAYASSEWKSKPSYHSNGWGESGQITYQTKNQPIQQPSPALKFKDSELQKLQSEFEFILNKKND